MSRVAVVRCSTYARDEYPSGMWCNGKWKGTITDMKAAIEKEIVHEE